MYHMGTLSRASKNRDMAREQQEKQQQVVPSSSYATSTSFTHSFINPLQVVDSAYGTTRSVKKVYL